MNAGGYDAAGNQTLLGSLRIGYDAKNRQTATQDGVYPATTYAYDGNGQRVWRSPGRFDVENAFLAMIGGV